MGKSKPNLTHFFHDKNFIYNNGKNVIIHHVGKHTFDSHTQILLQTQEQRPNQWINIFDGKGSITGDEHLRLDGDKLLHETRGEL